MCVSELVSCRSENWLLKKKLRDYEVTIENLEQLMTTIMSKQHKILGEMSQLRKRNRELQIECNLQREYHSMERNALVKELHDVKTLSRERLYDIVMRHMAGNVECSTLISSLYFRLRMTLRSCKTPMIVWTNIL